MSIDNQDSLIPKQLSIQNVLIRWSTISTITLGALQNL